MRTARVAIGVVLFVVGPIMGAGAATTVIHVRPGALAGWTKIHENAGVGSPSGHQSFLSGPGSPPSGAGSLWITSGSTDGSNEGVRHAIPGALTEVTTLAYTTRIPGSSTWPPLMAVNGAGSSGSLRVEFFPGMNGTILSNTWQAWTASSGTWYVRSGCGANQGEYLTFAQIKTQCSDYASHDLTIDVWTWGGATQFMGTDEYVDSVEVATSSSDTTWDFEPGQVSVANLRKPEGDAGTTSFRFTVSIPVATDTACTFAWKTADGTAKSPVDFGAYSGLARIDVGASSTKITVVVAGDRTHESDETFKVRLAAPESCSIGDGLAVGTIVNDD